jgi:mannose-6-phosphate isomerase-like protein (cupin superfamily)
MTSFYDQWLEDSERRERTVLEAPRVARGKDLKWVQTRQDAKAAIMIGPETGFPTGGSVLMRAEIPTGWHTGKHTHGEEAIYVEKGRGFMILDDRRYDFRPGTIFHVPYRSTHQLFNTGNESVAYISGLACLSKLSLTWAASNNTRMPEPTIRPSWLKRRLRSRKTGRSMGDA